MTAMTEPLSTPESAAPVFHYRLYHYQNGHGRDVFKAKERGFLWLHWFISIGELRSGRLWIDDPDMIWSTREDAIEGLRAYSARKLAGRQSERNAKVGSKLRLVIVEKVTL